MNAKPLRICILSREYPPETGWGGIGTFAYHLAHGLVEIGHEVEVVSMAKDKASETVLERIKIHRVEPYLKPNELGLLGRAAPHSWYVLNTMPSLWRKFVQLHRERPFDVVESPELLAEGIFPAITGIAPLVVRLYTPHSKFIAERLNNVSAKFDHQLIALAERIAMGSADALTSPSRDLAEYIARDINYPFDQIALIPNPIDAAQFCPEGPKAIDVPGQLKVLFVGRLEERKGIRYLVEAMPQIVKTVSNVHFYIIGEDTDTARGKKSVLAELRRFIRKTKCGANITFIPRVPLTELPAYYRSADVCVVPSLYDNSPYTCLEAMSCGRPVIGTKAGGTGEYLIDGESGILVEPRSSDALGKAIINLLLDTDVRNQLGYKARQRVLEKFQRIEVAGQTAELYRIAIQRFSARGQPLYVHNSEQVLADMDELIHGFHLMLHDLLLQQSFRYRLANFVHRLRTRPKLFLAESTLTVLKALLGESKGDSVKAPPVAWLENQIAIKHQAILESSKLSMLDHQLER